ncbi:transposase [Aeromonas hydrophila]|nr:transposase [Aeromonas hydrophila]BDO06278.1 hypothetical protein KAM622c_58650 [Klebsiella quasipneumoniae subsp. quasipneumoniae]BDO22608.1 hypothetical protein KAM645c_56980 [Klebsiella quasipneumoniae subsp. quasipneumoniae]GHS69157.1 hypothetical protein KPTHUN262_57000 [Klebsiella pneumoniae]GKK04325.1 hypothetical protein NUBL21985_47060 [Klebsiella pneumoniae]
MSRVLFRQIPKGARLLAMGNFFKESVPDAQWRLAVFLNQGSDMLPRRFGLEMLCVMGLGREFIAEDKTPYISHGFLKKLVLPPVDTWRESTLGECPRLSRRLARNPEVASQRCFVFEANGLTVWLPKFELARKLFFHAGFLVRSAFEPNGLDMAFSVQKEKEIIHIRTPAKTGAPSQLLKIKGYRDHFSWLLLDPDVRSSFESIWRSLNDEQDTGGTRYARWRFNFIPPSCLSGVTMEVQGPLDQDKRELLVWEIRGLLGLRFDCRDEIHFHHPSLRLSVKGEGGGRMPPAPGTEEIEVDEEEEPDDGRERQLLELPIEGIAFDDHPATRIAYQGQRAAGQGKRVDDDTVPGGEARILGLADDVTGGTVAPGEFQQLDVPKDTGQFPNRFVMLRNIIRQIAEEPGIELLELEVKSLPQVPRCSYHMMDENTPRCYLMARFGLEDGWERYLLEVDTSDNRKRLSTRIVIFRAEANARDCIDRILKDMVKFSLRWPTLMEKVCKSFHSIHHPKENSTDQLQVRVDAWVLRLKEGVKAL